MIVLYEKITADGGDSVSDPESKPKTLRPMTADAIAGTFDSLVELWEAREQSRANLDEYKQTNREPQLPENQFQSLSQLIKYNHDRWQYEQRLEDLSSTHAGWEQRFEEVAWKIRILLSEGRMFTHTYGGGDPNLQEVPYTIRHDPAESRGDSGVVFIQRMGPLRAATP
jgi:hypothetical protein